MPYIKQSSQNQINDHLLIVHLIIKLFNKYIINIAEPTRKLGNDRWDYIKLNNTT